MTTYPNNPVFPETTLVEEDCEFKNVTNCGGLTIREHFASLAMQALLTRIDPEPLALGRTAISYADGLIKALNGEPEPNHVSSLVPSQISKILIEWDGETWELLALNDENELAFVKGNDFVLLPLHDFFNAFGNAINKEAPNVEA